MNECEYNGWKIFNINSSDNFDYYIGSDVTFTSCRDDCISHIDGKDYDGYEGILTMDNGHQFIDEDGDHWDYFCIRDKLPEVEAVRVDEVEHEGILIKVGDTWKTPKGEVSEILGLSDRVFYFSGNFKVCSFGELITHCTLHSREGEMVLQLRPMVKEDIFNNPLHVYTSGRKKYKVVHMMPGGESVNVCSVDEPVEFMIRIADLQVGS